MNNKLKVSNLKKSYGNSLVINEISFEVDEGTIFALLGTNGAGKTTTLECIEGIKSYDSGSISINGKLGVQLQNSSLHPAIWLPVTLFVHIQLIYCVSQLNLSIDFPIHLSQFLRSSLLLKVGLKHQ